MTERAAARAGSAKIRKDPEFRPIDGGFYGVKLKNRRPDRHYVVVNEADQDALQDYNDKGYIVEKYCPDGVVPVAGKTGKDGDEIRIRGGVLMSLDNETKQAIDDVGLKRARGRMKKIRALTGGVRDLRGLSRDVSRVFEGKARIESDISMPPRGKEE